ncbi:MAG: sugar phosphate isomerase/epimerase [Acidobacteria bacterium]|nr:sugar phosphate isomerase/epimerase [Acidobacteriota bacterium]
MQIGVNTLIWTAGFGTGHVPVLGEIKAHGFDLVEIARFSWDGFPTREIRTALDGLGLGRAVCTAFTSPANFCNPDPAQRGQALDFVKQSVDQTAALGASTLVGPLHGAVGQLVGRRRNASEWGWITDGLRSAGEYAAQAGVTIAVEPLNRFECYALNTAVDAARLCEEVGLDNVGILYDTFHAHIEEKNQGEALAACGRHLKHMHTCENDRGTPGSGQVNWIGVFAALKHLDYDGALVIESFGFAIPEIAAAACIWRDLAPSPEQIAWDGIGFLRSW